MPGRGEVGDCSRGAHREQLERVIRLERRERNLHLARQLERRAAGDEHVQARALREEVADERSRVEELLQVVEAQEKLAVPDGVREVIPVLDLEREGEVEGTSPDP